MKEVDQGLRRRVIGGEEGLLPRLRDLDRAHALELRAMLEELGRWPGHELVGAEGADAAWLLAQHADHDRAFQEFALGLLEHAVEAGQAPGMHLAYLEDRVLVGQGKPQRYGTQARLEDGTIVFHPIDDPEGVDARRSSLGMPPLATYRAQLERMYEGMKEESE